MAQNREGRTARWWARNIIAGLLGVLFLFVGSVKLSGAALMTQQFAAWGYPSWFMYVVGACEVIGGAFLIAPRVRRIGALILTAIMVGAAATHLMAAEWTAAPIPLVILALLIWIGKSSPMGAKVVRQRRTTQETAHAN